MARKITIAILFILLIFSFSASASEILSSAKNHDSLGWELKWQKQGIEEASENFLKAIDGYKEYIEKNKAAIADLETRKFTVFDAQKRIVYIYKFGLNDQALAKKEFRKLLDMYNDFADEFNANKVVIRVKSKISQLNTEFKYRGCVLSTEEDNLLCLFLGKFSGDELIIYEDLIPVARAKIQEIKAAASSESIILAKVFRKNPVKKIKPFFSVQAANSPAEVEDKNALAAEEYYRAGMGLFEKRDFAGAEKNFWFSLKYNPDYKEALNMLGLIYFDYQEIENAVKHYIMALEIDPAYLEAFIDLAGAYLGSNDFPVDTNNVFDMLEASIAVNPNYTRAYYWMGHALDDFMFFDRARQYYEKGQQTVAVLAVDNWYKQTSLKKKLSSPGQIYWDTANICLDNRDPMLNSSIYAFDELLTINPDDIDAKERLKQILKICPFARDSSTYKKVILHRTRGLGLEKQGRWKEAIDEVRISLYLDQIITSEFRKCTQKIPRIRID